MAILPAIAGVRTEILVNHIPLKEYDDPDEEALPANVAHKYIEASSGMNFAIRTVYSPYFDSNGHDVVLYIHIDGKYMDNIISERGYLKTGTTVTLNGARTQKANQWFQQDFRFSEVKTNDGDSRTVGEEVLNTLKDVGLITVKIYRVERIKDANPKPGLQELGLRQLGTVPEKALKGRALTHQASLGARRTIPSLKTTPLEFIDSTDRPLATFNFRYRSRSALQSLFIIPRSPSPVPLEDRDVEDLTPEEMRELLRRQRERVILARPIKRELKRERSEEGSSDEVDPDELSFISERQRKTRRVSGDPVETIDLT